MSSSSADASLRVRPRTRPSRAASLSTKLKDFRLPRRLPQMSRAMMAGRISACPMACWIPVALHRSTSSSGTVPPKNYNAPSA
eukprot:16431591-Heterocapsa_arctica.AAC.1